MLERVLMETGLRVATLMLRQVDAQVQIVEIRNQPTSTTLPPIVPLLTNEELFAAMRSFPPGSAAGLDGIRP